MVPASLAPGSRWRRPVGGSLISRPVSPARCRELTGAQQRDVIDWRGAAQLQRVVHALYPGEAFGGKDLLYSGTAGPEDPCGKNVRTGLCGKLRKHRISGLVGATHQVRIACAGVLRCISVCRPKASRMGDLTGQPSPIGISEIAALRYVRNPARFGQIDISLGFAAITFDCTRVPVQTPEASRP